MLLQLKIMSYPLVMCVFSLLQSYFIAVIGDRYMSYKHGLTSPAPFGRGSHARRVPIFKHVIDLTQRITLHQKIKTCNLNSSCSSASLKAKLVVVRIFSQMLAMLENKILNSN